MQLIAFAGCVCALFLTGQGAMAHPHVWLSLKVELNYHADGSLTGIRHIWTFEEMFTAFTVSGLTKKDGTFSREQLMPLARRYVGSLKNYDYFTFGKGDGAKLEFADPPDYWFEYEEGVLILHFILPLKTPAKLKQLALEIYDPTYFVALSPADKNPASLRQAPPDCKLQVGVPTRAQVVDESFFANLPDARNWAVQFATVMTVACP